MGQSISLTATIKEVALKPGEDLESQCRNLLNKRGIEPDDIYESAAEQLEDELEKEFIVVKGILYNFLEIEKEEISDNLFAAFKSKNGKIHLAAQYYDGAVGLKDAIEYSMDKLKS